MKKMNRMFAAGLSAALLAGAVPANLSAAGDAHLNFGCYVYSTSFDPAYYQNAAWTGCRLGITECLFKFNNDASVEPLLCDTYEVSDDHMTWTFHIRDGVQFSNGDVCDAQAAADSLNRLFTVCKGEEYSSTPSQYIDMNSITADVDANTVTIVTNRAYPDLTAILCFPFYSIIDVDGDLDDSNHAGGYGADIIATGPYAVSYFDELSKNGELVANEYYWKEEVPFDGVTVLHMEDDTTKAMALQSGDIDLTENVTTDQDLEALGSDDSYYVSMIDGVRTGFAWVNFSGVLGNDDLRKAVFMAIDGPTLCDVTVGGMYTYGPGVIPEGLGYGEMENPYAYDQAGAVALLDGAGIVDSDGDGIRELDGENINLNFVTYKNRRLNDFAEAIQVQLAAIGIGCSINSTDSDTNWMLMQSGEYDLLNQNWSTILTGDPTTYLLNWYGGEDGSNLYDGTNEEATNYTHGYENDEYDALYDQFTASLDVEERNSLVGQMEQILVDDAACLVHGYYKSTMISNASKVQGADMSTFDYYWLSTAIKPAE